MSKHDIVHGQHLARHTKAYAVTIGRTILFFSYETLIGVSGPKGEKVTNIYYSKTTSRHLSEFDMDAGEKVPPDELQQYAMDSIYHDMLRDMQVFEGVLTA